MNKTSLAMAAIALVSLTAGALAQPPAPGGPPPAGASGMPPGPPGGMPPPKTAAQMHYDAAIDVVDGRPGVAAQAAARVGGKPLHDGAATGVQLHSDVVHANGLVVRGHAPFTLADSQIDMSGGGLSDFDGVAAGALVRDDATLTLRDVHITTNGIVSSAAVAMDKGTLKVIHSTLVANGGPAPSGYVRRIGPGMMEPPTPLGIVGTARTTLTMGEAHSYFVDSTIIAEGWGALSTDAAHGAYLQADHCDIRVLRSGYGTYADNGASVVINHSKMDVATFAGIIAGQASIAFNNVQSVSHGNTVMIHSVMGTPQDLGTLTFKGGRYASTNAAILVKSANADITIDGAVLTATNRDLLLVEKNDDSHATDVAGQKVAGVHATIRNATLSGNLLDLDPDRGLAVKLESSTIKGTIRGATLSLDAASRWTADADSDVVLADGSDASRIDAPAGVTIKAVAANAPKGTITLHGGGTLVIQ